MEEKNGERKECADRNERTAAEGEGRKAGCTEEYVWCALLYNFLLCLLNEKTFSKTCLYNSDDALRRQQQNREQLLRRKTELSKKKAAFR